MKKTGFGGLFEPSGGDKSQIADFCISTRIPVKNDRGFPAIFTTRTFGHRKFLKSPKIPEFRNSSLKLYNTYGFKQEFRNFRILQSFFFSETPKFWVFNVGGARDEVERQPFGGATALEE